MDRQREQELSQEIRNAGQAKEVLNSEAFKDAVRQVEEALLGGMKMAPIADEKLRLRLLDKYEALHALLSVLHNAVDTGLMAEEELRRKSISEQIKDFLVN